MALHALVGYQVTEEIVRLYCNKRSIGRFHDVGALLSGRGALQTMLNSPSDSERKVQYISSQEDEIASRRNDADREDASLPQPQE